MRTKADGELVPLEPQYFAPCPRGLQDFLANEAHACGAADVSVSGAGVKFSGPLAAAYQLNLSSRIASRVLMRVASGRYRIDKDLYKIASRVAWENYMRPDQSLRVDIRAVRSNLRSLKMATLRVKDAVVDRLREHTGERPNIDTVTPDVRVAIFLEDQQASLYLDLSGDNLFKRGWRHSDDKGDAPIKENLAAGLLNASGWTGQAPLFDPFCGSGTIAIEAAQQCGGVLPQCRERFGLHRLQTFDATIWTDASARAQAQAQAQKRAESKAEIFAGDISAPIVALARANGISAGLAADAITFRVADFLNSRPPTSKPGWIVSNLPYGERMNIVGRGDVWRDMGNHLKKNYVGWTICLLSSDLKLPGKLGLRERRKFPLYNGTLDCRLFIFDIQQ